MSASQIPYAFAALASASWPELNRADRRRVVAVGATLALSAIVRARLTVRPGWRARVALLDHIGWWAATALVAYGLLRDIEEDQEAFAEAVTSDDGRY